MPFRRVLFLNSGSCTQSGYLAGRAVWGWTRFHAVFVYLEHPEHGAALIDTGYSPRFLHATRGFPQRLYRWATPVQLDPLQQAWAILAAQGLRPDEVGKVFVSHFHGDHIAGLRHFPTARFVYRSAAHAALQRLSVWQQVHHGFLADLLPEDFTARGDGLPDVVFKPGCEPLAEFGVHDYWGNGDLLLVDLPGHAIGHTGYLLRMENSSLLYVVDATWGIGDMLQARPLPRLSQTLQYAYADYVATQERLRRLAARGECALVACHCPRTQALVLQGRQACVGH
jgi:glyoxylase-like metal-dependent hydrolase (beta-lactamase superfamily II)